jgi:hypothetical protein
MKKVHFLVCRCLLSKLYIELLKNCGLIFSFSEANSDLEFVRKQPVPTDVKQGKYNYDICKVDSLELWNEVCYGA